MIKIRKPTIWQTPVWQAVIEGIMAALLFLTAMILVVDELPDATVRSGFFFGAVIAGTVAGFRAMPGNSDLRPRIIRFSLAALSLTLIMPISPWILGQLLGQPTIFERSGIGGFDSVVMLGGSSIVYFCWRVFGVAWRRWQHLRRTRFAWSLTASFVNIVTGVVLFFMVVYFIFLMFQNYTGETIEDASFAARFLRELAVFIFPQLMIFWFGLVIVVLSTIPPVLFLSYFSTRRLTRRVEALAVATRQLQTGDYSARTPVNGEDEVAQLQTAFNQMAEALQTTTQALQSERDKVATLLKTQKELTASISHELRTPVATLHAYLENNLTQNPDLPTDLQSDLKIMLQETEHLQKMVDDLFTLAQKEVNQLSLQLEPVDLESFIGEWVEKYRPVAWRNHKVELQCALAPDLPTISADPMRLEQIVNNLVQNAVRHTLPGGLVQVEAAHVDGGARLSVRDNGEGIPAVELEHVWERYFRGKNRQHQGSGLGLALVKELAESMGAQVGVESCPGEGSHFWVVFKVNSYQLSV